MNIKIPQNAPSKSLLNQNFFENKDLGLIFFMQRKIVETSMDY